MHKPIKLYIPSDIHVLMEEGNLIRKRSSARKVSGEKKRTATLPNPADTNGDLRFKAKCDWLSL